MLIPGQRRTGWSRRFCG